MIDFDASVVIAGSIVQMVDDGEWGSMVYGLWMKNFQEESRVDEIGVDAVCTYYDPNLGCYGLLVRKKHRGPEATGYSYLGVECTGHFLPSSIPSVISY